MKYSEKFTPPFRLDEEPFTLKIVDSKNSIVVIFLLDKRQEAEAYCAWLNEPEPEVKWGDEVEAWDEDIKQSVTGRYIAPVLPETPLYESGFRHYVYVVGYEHMPYMNVRPISPERSEIERKLSAAMELVRELEEKLK